MDNVLSFLAFIAHDDPSPKHPPHIFTHASCLQVSTVIKNGAGVTGNLLVPQEPFELLVRRAITQLLPPALQCKEAVHEV